MSTEKKDPADLPPIAKWVLSVLKASTWRENPLIAVLTLVIILGVTVSATLATYLAYLAVRPPQTTDMLTMTFQDGISLRDAVGQAAGAMNSVVRFDASCDGADLDIPLDVKGQLRAPDAASLIEALDSRFEVARYSPPGQIEVSCDAN